MFQKGSITAKFIGDTKSFDRATKNVEGSLGKMSSRVKSAQDRLLDLQRRKETLISRLSQLARENKNTGDSYKRLQDRLANLNDRIDTQKIKMTEMGSTAKKTAWFMSPEYFKTHLLANALGHVLGRAILNVTRWLTDMIGQAITSGREFEKMSALMAASGGFAAETTEKLNEAIFKLGRETNFTAGEVQEAFRMYQKNGGDVQKAMDGLMDATLKYAQITGSELAPAIDLVTDIQGIYGDKLSENFDLTQILVGGNEEAKWSTEGYRDALIEILPNASKFTDSIEDMNALIPLTASYFSSASEQGTGLRRMLSEIANPKKWNNFKNIGVDVLDAEGNMRSFKDIISDTSNQLAGKSFEDVQKFYGGFDDRARRGIEATVNEFGRLDETVLNIANYDVEGMFEATMTGADRLAATIDTLGIEFMQLEIGGQAIGDIIDRLAGKIADIAQKIFDQLQPALESMQPFFDWIVANKEPVIAAISGVALVMGIALIPTLITGAVAMWSFLSPILLLVAVGAVIGLVLWGLYEAFKWMWSEDFLGIKTFLTLLWQEMQKVWDIIVTAVKPALMELWAEFQNLWAAIKPIIDQHLPMLKELFMDVLVWTIKNIIMPALRNFRDFFQLVLPHALNILVIGINNVTTVIRTWAEFIKNNVDTIKSIFKSMVDFVRKLFSGDFRGAIDEAKNIVMSIGDLDMVGLGKDLIRGLITGIKNMAGAAWNAAGDLVNGIKNRITGELDINSPSRWAAWVGEMTWTGYIDQTEKEKANVAQSSQEMMAEIQDPINQQASTALTNNNNTSNNNFNNTNNNSFNITGGNSDQIMQKVVQYFERQQINSSKGMNQNYA